MSQLPDIHYSPGISRLQDSGRRRGAYLPASRFPTAQPAGQLIKTQTTRQFWQNAWLVNKLPWFF